ncbi:MAG: hypothetical protein WD009_13470 [Phycisphaeraceae bacterium]
MRKSTISLVLATIGLGFGAAEPGVQRAWAEVAEVAGGVAGERASSVSQWGITWHFDEAHEVGMFANGDYWVVGPVTITRITPEFDGEVNGWEVNPRVEGRQGFTGSGAGRTRPEHFDADLVPELPYTAQPGESIVKAIGGEDAPGNDREVALRTAAVLTVLDAPPPDGGAGMFRPPYVGDDKPMYRIEDLRTDLLPSWPHVPLAQSDVTLEWVEKQFQRVQLDHKSGLLGRGLHPFENIPDYGGDIGRRNGDAVLRLMLDDPIEERMPALIAYVQYGIDLYHMYLDGHRWGSGGGHRPGQKIALVFAAVMLGDEQMIADVTAMADEQFLSEDANVYYSEHADDGRGKVLFGVPGNERQYWTYIEEGRGNRSIRDPYGYIDGGEAPASYQLCCLSQPWKGQVLAVHLMPELRPVWNNELVIDYIERWVTHGTWALPDPIAKQLPETFDGRGVSGEGRFPDHHGSHRDSGGRGSAFQRELWDAYRDDAREQ